MRGLITDLLADGGIPVVGEAKDGVDALSVIAETQPDVVTMDLKMPRMNGIEAVEKIMADQPTPVLMLSAYTDDDATVTFEALEKGAVDFFAKPGGEVSMGVSRLADQLIATVQSVADADLQRAGRKNATPATATVPAAGSARSMPDLPPFDDTRTVVIGSSTGGPNAVEQVLQKLPAGDCRVLVVQHMPEAFTARFADRLDENSAYDIREASDGARIGAGEALVARGGTHMEISNYRRGRLRVKLIDDDRGHTVMPAVDVTMQSAAEQITDPLTGVILTGMGSDGTDGICAIRDAGGRTIAQNEDSCVIYGMPKRAIEAGCIEEVCHLDAVASTVRELV